MAQTAEIGALHVTLALNAGEFRRGSKRVQQDIGTLGKALGEISERINEASFHFNNGITAARRFADAAMSVVGVAAEFGKGMASVSTLVDTAAESMTEMGEAVLAIGRKVPVPLAELTQGLYDIRSAGIPASDAIDVLNRSARLAVAGLGTTREAADLVTSSLNAFGLKGRDAAEVYNNIFKTIQAGKTTISGLAQGFGAVAGTVATAGVKLDEYLASVAALTVTGLPAAVAHTQLRAAIAGLTRESEIGKAVLDALGAKTFKELIDKAGGMVNAFKLVTQALGGNDANIIKLLGSVEAYNAVVALTGRQNTVFTDTLGKMRNGIDTVGGAFDKQNATMSSSLQRLTNAVTQFGIAFGNALAPVIEEVTDFVTGITEAFKNLTPEMQELIARFGMIAAAIGPGVIAAGFFANALGALIPVFTTIGATVAALIASTGPIGLFVISASAAVTAWNIFKDDIITIFSAVWRAISDTIDKIVERLKGLGTFIGAVFSQLASGEFTRAWETLGAGIQIALSGANAEADKLIGKMDDLANPETRAKPFSLPGMPKPVDYTGPIVTDPGGEEKARADAQRLHNAELRNYLQLRRLQAEIEEEIDPITAKLAETQDRLNRAFQKGAIDSEQLGIALAKASAVAQNAYASVASGIVSDLGKVFESSKAIAVAQALINTYQSVTNALANVPYPLNLAAAAASLAAGMAQVANIRKTTKGSGGGGGGGAGAAGAGAAAPAAPMTTLRIEGIDPSRQYSGAAVRGLVEEINDFVRNGGILVSSGVAA